MRNLQRLTFTPHEIFKKEKAKLFYVVKNLKSDDVNEIGSVKEVRKPTM